MVDSIRCFFEVCENLGVCLYHWTWRYFRSYDDTGRSCKLAGDFDPGNGDFLIRL